MTSPTPVAYVFHGADEPGLRDRLAEFLAGLGDPANLSLNTSRIEGGEATAGDIEAAARAVPFLAEIRLVMVENLTETTGGRAVIEHLAALISGLPDWSRVVFVETGLQDGGDEDRRRGAGRQQALRQLVNVVESDPRGMVLAFELPQDIARWLAERARRHQAELAPGAARALAERIGGDLVLADSELAKLATYTRGERPISEGDVDLLTPYAAEANVFKMVDALGKREGQTALTLLRRLLDNGDDPLRIFGMITRQYRLLIQMREHLDRGGSVGSAASALDMKDFVARKVAEQARLYRIEQLERIFAHLLDVDESVKTGKLAADLALEQLVARLAGRG